MSADQSTELKKKLRSVLLSRPGGVDLKRVAADYRQLVGEPLPIREQGFTDVTSFLKAYPDVAQYALKFIIIIIIRNEYDYGGVMSEDCKDTLQTKQ